MKKILEIIKGCIIGIACVVPGLSGGTLAISMGIYEDLIYCVNNVLKTPIKCIKKMWTYILGIIVGVILSVLVISSLFIFAPVVISMLFVGLVLGSIPTIFPKIDKVDLGLKDAVAFCAFAGIILFIPTLTTGITKEIIPNLSGAFTMTLLGLLLAATIIIPGVSGSMIFMVLGYYEGTMNMASNALKNLMTLNFVEAITSGKMLIPLVIGAIIGIFALAKLLESLLKKYKRTVYWGILGIIVASPFPIIIGLNLYSLTAITGILSVIALVVGMYATIVISKEDRK